MCRTAEFKSVWMSSKPSFNGQTSADEDVSAEASMGDWQLLKSSAVGRENTRTRPERITGRASNGLLKAAREIGMMGVERIRGKSGLDVWAKGRADGGEERVRKRDEESAAGR